MELNFEKLFKVPLIAMKINRSDPAIKKDLKWLVQFLLIHGEYTGLFIIVVHNILFINLKEEDFSQTCKNGVLTVVYIAITFQYSILLWKQNHLKLLMNAVKQDYIIAKTLPKKEQELIKSYALKGHSVCKQWLVMTVVGTVLFPLKNLVLISWYWITTGEVLKIPMYPLVYPDFIEKKKETLLVYLCTYFATLEYASYSSVMYCAFVPLGPIFLLHACGQLEVVKVKIEHLFEDGDVEEVKIKLNDIVKHLQYIYGFVDRVKLCFTVAYEMTLKTTTILLPVTCYEVMEVDHNQSTHTILSFQSLKHGDVSLEFIVFIVGGVLFSSSPCYYGDLLMEKGEDVRLAMYSCGWERLYNREIRSTIRIIQQRALRPVAIRTLFRTVCLDALTDLFQQSFTIFNLMNAAWN